MLAKNELGESLGHLRMAAAYAADGAADRLAPSVEAARKAVKPQLKKARGVAKGSVDSVFGAALNGTDAAKRTALKARKKMLKKQKPRRRWPMVAGGLLAAGAVVGTASALMRRRRAQQAWDEYDSTRVTEDVHAKLDSAKSTMDAGVDKVSAAAKDAKDRASDLIGAKNHNKP
jgi:hypothetical protein